MSAERQARRRLHPKFVALVDKHGLELRRAESGHWDVLRGGRRLLSVASSASDHRTRLNEVTRLRRALGEHPPV